MRKLMIAPGTEDAEYTLAGWIDEEHLDLDELCVEVEELFGTVDSGGFTDEDGLEVDTWDFVDYQDLDGDVSPIIEFLHSSGLVQPDEG